MIDDENHPEMNRAMRELTRRLAILSNGKSMTRALIEQMYDCVKQHRATERAKGIDFPVLVAIVIPRLGIVEWARADLELASIKTKIVNFVRFNPAARMEEIVVAFVTAYPHLKPDDFLAQHQIAVDADKRQAERQARYMAEAERIVREEGDK